MKNACQREENFVSQVAHSQQIRQMTQENQSQKLKVLKHRFRAPGTKSAQQSDKLTQHAD